MDFFEAQENARRRTRWLVVLFLLSVISLLLLAEVLVVTVLFYGSRPQDGDILVFLADLDPGIHVTVILIVLLVIAGGAWYRAMQLNAGGFVIATMLGGKLLAQNSDVIEERRLLNVVEEMAIAAGVPVPQVYVQQGERGINAFAAGQSTDDAVICVTQGALEALNRDALQGVVAHEFSHILNGDMRLNLKITSILYGILLLGLIGARMLRHLRFRSSSSRNKGGGAIVLLSAGLMVIGFGGTFFGNLIKATVNRQREFLADASAVQFTRNPDGLAAALKAVGGYAYGSKLIHPAAAEISHFFFASGAAAFLQSLFSTHPPLKERILRIQPDWDGVFPQVTTSYTRKITSEELTDGKQAVAPAAVAMTVAAADALAQLDTIGQLDERHVAQAQHIVATLPAALKAAAHDPYQARGLVYALLLSHDAELRKRQMDIVNEHAEQGVGAELPALYNMVSALTRDYYLPLIEIAIPALQSCSPRQIERFRLVMNKLIRVDNHISLFEWCVSTLLDNTLTPGTTKTRPNRRLDRAAIQVRVVLSVLAQAEMPDTQAGQQAFAKALRYLQLTPGDMYRPQDLPFNIVNNALRQLARLVPLDKKRFIEACIITVRANRSIDPRELEVLRAIAAAIRSPMPPLVAGAVR